MKIELASTIMSQVIQGLSVVMANCKLTETVYDILTQAIDEITFDLEVMDLISEELEKQDIHFTPEECRGYFLDNTDIYSSITPTKYKFNTEKLMPMLFDNATLLEEPAYKLFHLIFGDSIFDDSANY